MISSFFFILYMMLSFFILITISMALPRIVKVEKNKPFYIYIGYYIINSVVLNYIFRFYPIKTIFLNIFMLLICHFVGSRLRLQGLTGQICCGKTTVAKYLEYKYKAAIINIDELNRQVLELPEVKKEIKRKFGDEIYDSSGEILNKQKMRKIIFSDISKRKQLESITHGKVFKLLFLRVIKEKFLYNNKFVFIENAILLRFTIFKYLCYPILAICTTLKAEVIGRVMQRDVCDREAAEKIMQAQMTTDEFVKQSDYVVFNDGDVQALYQEVDKFMSQIL